MNRTAYRILPAPVRQPMIALGLAALLLLAAFTTVPLRHASATAEWCWDDPMVYVDGVQTGSIAVGIPASALGHLTSSTPVTITLNVVGDHTVTTAPLPGQTPPFAVKVVVVHSAPGAGHAPPIISSTTTVSADQVVPVAVDATSADGAHTVRQGTSAAPIVVVFTPMMLGGGN